MPFRTVLGILAISLLAGNARAEVVYLDYSSTGNCPTRDEFERQIQARTALVEFVHAPQPGRFFVVHAEDAPKKAIGRVTSGRDREVGSAREVSSPSCSDVAAALALIVALSIDPRANAAPTVVVSAGEATSATPAADASASTSAPPTAAFPTEQEVASPSPTSPSTSASSTVPATNQPTNAPALHHSASLPRDLAVPKQATPVQDGSVLHQTRSITFAVGPRFGAALWVNAPVTALGSVALTLSAESTQTTLFAAAAQLSFTYARSTRVNTTDSGSAAFEIWSAEFTYCPLRFELGPNVLVRPCGAVEGGRLTATGYTDGILDHAEPQNRPWGMLSELARMQVRLSDDFQLNLEAGLGEPLGLYRFVFDTLPQETRIATVPVLVPRLNLDLAWRFL